MEIVKETDQNQSNISYHLSCLLGCGLDGNRREGKNVFYNLNNERAARFLKESDSVLNEIVRGLDSCVNYNESLVNIKKMKMYKLKGKYTLSSGIPIGYKLDNLLQKDSIIFFHNFFALINMINYQHYNPKSQTKIKNSSLN